MNCTDWCPLPQMTPAVYSTLSMFVNLEKRESFYNIENIFELRTILKGKMPEYMNLYFLPVVWETLIRMMLFI